MKKIIIYFAVLFLSGCSGSFLELDPPNNKTEAIAFRTEDHFTQAVNGIYAAMRGIYAENDYILNEMRSDNTHYMYDENSRGVGWTTKEAVTNFTVEINNSPVYSMWAACYSGISRANTILGRIGGTTLSDDFKDKITAEAKFMRAFFYFHLVRYFGSVPLHLEEVKNEKNAFLPQSATEQVYEAIIDDVKEAIAHLPVVKFNDSGAASGSATKGAAQMLYAYVLMTKPTRDYAEAEKQLKDVLNTMGYGLMDDYADVFDTSKKNSKEHIFSVQYQMGDQGLQSNWLYRWSPRTKEAEPITGVELSNLINDAGWNIPTQAMIDTYESGDLRLNPSIAVAVGKPDGGPSSIIIDDVLRIGDPKIANYEMAVPFINKYRHAHIKVNNTDDNWPIYRYADALLLMAECLVEQGRAGEAVTYVNKVRTRAGLPSLATVTAETVAKERKIELAFENHRWFDLVRTGKMVEVMAAYGKYIMSVDKSIPEQSYNIKPEYALYPIPYNEMQVNKLLKQNPGY